MNLVFLSPHFPPNYYNFCVRLKELGITVLGVGETPFAELRNELKESLADYFQTSNMEEYDNVLRALGYFVFRHGRLNRIESHNEHWLQMEAQLREDFNIPGMRPQEMENVKRKSIMRKIFQKAGIPIAEGMKYSNPQEVKQFVSKVGFPIFAKPDIGVGANQTFKIHNECELEEFFNKKPHSDYVIERFVDGNLVTFDGLTDSRGNIVFCISHFSETGVFEVVDGNTDLSYYSLREIPTDLLELGTQAVKAFGIREKFFHFEFLRGKLDQKLTALEINMRPPGGFTTDIMNFSCDIDVYKAWAQIIKYGYTDLEYERKYHCAHIARKNGKRYKWTHEEILSRYGSKIMAFCEVSLIFSPVMGNFAYIARSQSLDEIKEIISFIQAKA